MKKKLLALTLGICLVAGCLSGCSFDYDYVPVDTETDTIMEDETGVGMPNLTRTLPVHGEDFSLICKYDTGKYSLKDWHVTDVKSINMDVHTKDLPEDYDVIVEHMHADISLVSTSAQLNGITQDSMDNSFHGTSQDGFAVDDKTSYYRTFDIEGYTDQFYQLWGYAFGGYGTTSSDYKRLTEYNIIHSGTYAERLSVVYDLAIKAPGDTKYHSVSVSDNILIPVSMDLSERTQAVEDNYTTEQKGETNESKED